MGPTGITSVKFVAKKYTHFSQWPICRPARKKRFISQPPLAPDGHQSTFVSCFWYICPGYPGDCIIKQLDPFKNCNEGVTGKATVLKSSVTLCGLWHLVTFLGRLTWGYSVGYGVEFGKYLWLWHKHGLQKELNRSINPMSFFLHIACVLPFEEVTSHTFESLQSSCHQSCDRHKVLREATKHFRMHHCRLVFEKEHQDPAEAERYSTAEPQQTCKNWTGKKILHMHRNPVYHWISVYLQLTLIVPVGPRFAFFFCYIKKY